MLLVLYRVGGGGVVKVVAAFLAAVLRNEPGTTLIYALITTRLIVKTRSNSTVKLFFSYLRPFPSYSFLSYPFRTFFLKNKTKRHFYPSGRTVPGQSCS